MTFSQKKMESSWLRMGLFQKKEFVLWRQADALMLQSEKILALIWVLWRSCLPYTKLIFFYVNQEEVLAFFVPFMVFAINSRFGHSTCAYRGLSCEELFFQ